MKKLFVMLLAVIGLILTSCTDKNPIWETDPMDPTFASGFPLDRFHQLGIAHDTLAQKAMVDEYRKVLTKNVLNHYPCIRDEKNVHFILGSGSVKHVLSADGNTYSGKFDNELIIILTDSCVRDTLFLACGNGMLSPIRFKSYSDLGTAEKCRFEIAPGKGLATYLPELQAWAKVAGEMNIPVLDKNGKIVSQETYLHYLGRYQSYLFPGDVIDMCSGSVYNKNGQIVQFKTRFEASKKANVLARKKVKRHKR